MARERVLDSAGRIDSQAGKRCVKLWARRARQDLVQIPQKLRQTLVLAQPHADRRLDHRHDDARPETMSRHVRQEQVRDLDVVDHVDQVTPHLGRWAREAQRLDPIIGEADGRH